jgi:hypothetical protein
LRSLWPSALVGSMISLTNCFCKKVKREGVSSGDLIAVRF